MKASDYKDETKGWPRTVPVLTAEDFVDNDLHHRERGNDYDNKVEKGEKDGCKRCFLDWARYAFRSTWDGKLILYSEEDIVCQHIDQELAKRSVGLGSFYDSFTKRECAALWNRTMMEFGYTEDA